MRVCFIVFGSWLLLNLLFVLIVIPPREPRSLATPIFRAVDVIKSFFKRPKR